MLICCLLAAPAFADEGLGAANSPVTMVEYSSFACGHCADFHQNTLPRLMADYIDTGKLRYVMHVFPIRRFDVDAALLLSCAPEEKYYPLVASFFAYRHALLGSNNPKDAIAWMSKRAGITTAHADLCLNDMSRERALRRQVTTVSKRHGLTGTPGFVFNDGEAILAGNVPYETFAAQIDALIAKRQP